MSCSTLGKVIATLPDLKDIIVSAVPTNVPACNSVALTEKEVMYMIAKARDEPREGCWDGVPEITPETNKVS